MWLIRSDKNSNFDKSRDEVKQYEMLYPCMYMCHLFLFVSVNFFLVGGKCSTEDYKENFELQITSSQILLYYQVIKLENKQKNRNRRKIN